MFVNHNKSSKHTCLYHTRGTWLPLRGGVVHRFRRRLHSPRPRRRRLHSLEPPAEAEDPQQRDDVRQPEDDREDNDDGEAARVRHERGELGDDGVGGGGGGGDRGGVHLII